MGQESSEYHCEDERETKRIYDSEEDDATRTYDLSALKYCGTGPGTTFNFLIECYTKKLEEMRSLSKEEFLASLRPQSIGFSRGASKYRGPWGCKAPPQSLGGSN
ncbi:unnamed protein product [Cuscuta europaea]|uniref:Uncharacterized protein n=1 Tax=Cuscuta europaea TaxID=41803 RepID=A0A9P0YM23_CUSEU|nr:unnamed protein product [Cuscuta europaea]